MRTWISWSLVVLSLMAAGCGHDNKSPDIKKKLLGDSKKTHDTAASVPRLSTTDLMPELNPAPLTESELSTDLKNTAEFYAKFPGIPARSACNAVIGAQKLQATKTVLTMSGAVDLTACENQDSGETDRKYTQVLLEVFAELTCPTADLSTFDGKTWDEIKDPKHWAALCGAAGSSIIESSKKYLQSKKGLTQFSDETYFSGVKKSAGLAPCGFLVKNGKLIYNNDCVVIGKTSLHTIDNPVVTHYWELAFVNVSAAWPLPATQNWYSTGEMQATYDDWKGTVTFSKEAAPTYRFTQRGGASSAGRLPNEREAGNALKLF